jgi:phage gp36-like protein
LGTAISHIWFVFILTRDRRFVENVGTIWINALGDGMAIAVYCTAEEMTDLFGLAEMTQISNLDNPAAQYPDEERVNRAIKQASADIDRYLTAQSVYPITSEMVLSILNGICLDIARYNLESRGEVRPDVKTRYDAAIAWLTQVAKGEINLVPSPDSSSQADSAIAFGSDKRYFTADTMRTFTDAWTTR